ncbi:MAG: hypothetical protein UU40_C0001G0053 [Candidatus Uhrbacteria bacterium GW2011_GWD2_41_121]|uniref:Uncharacterized protein n=1 Tax=Candidatus Uhrbacteria bacterium GW2011_GWC1_41_20 TaxID=1618983 RepID=A0A0G0VG58_9BACT|nr:MAG: hypothetical protein UT52_C0001G0017 [Candidatus Uhrbacteria bacterium GW2011_GWE1_39_46]KKR64406.1 MAG: hypothetical protein UU04_C0002G0017 [Candidatus Uhrbacteria bacterium GW2011_GWC2_40_450]KKR90715.1 MAG: hypothetical protein UU40_C0001G0053 [Candidatus Uhrbacteria bacterium GW2011_GWD2_41_121]KKR96568.1 MAG: hypothetical protein UU46_C0001G0017 [Candidatus Uhrbacteria bacterium GW2011_GWD1_41_16]KKR99959.1 MAG: hypothetical protein UU50_C0001G0017 [Candidatus Uhrbacteria bacteriu
MPEQMQTDIPSQAQIADADAFMRRCLIVGAIALVFGLAWWLALEQVTSLLDMSRSAFQAGMDWGLVPAMFIGALVGALATTSRPDNGHP